MADSTTLIFIRNLAAAGGGGNLWQMGEAMGLSRDETEALSFEMMSAGYLEMVSLSGGVKLTEAGAAAASPAGAAAGPADLNGLVESLKSLDTGWLSESDAIDFSVDVTSLEVQLARSRPLAEVVAACSLAIARALAGNSDPKAAALAARARQMAGK